MKILKSSELIQVLKGFARIPFIVIALPNRPIQTKFGTKNFLPSKLKIARIND